MRLHHYKWIYFILRTSLNMNSFWYSIKN
jgi:hypothetical protein